MQVWSENELVGELRVRPQDIQGQHLVLHTLSELPNFVPGGFDDDSLIAAPTYETYRLPVVKRAFRIEDHQMELMDKSDTAQFLREMRRRYHIPVDADVAKLVATYETVYTWKVVNLTAAEVEKIFDMDIFEPSEFGAPDIERRMAELPHLGFTV